MKARYIRISSSTQSSQRQLARQHPDERVYIDVISGSIPFVERPAANELMQAISNGTINQVSFSSIDRCGRNAFDIQFTLNWFMQSGCNVKIDNLGIESILPNGKPNSIFNLISSVLANVAEMEREAIRERQLEGIALAKAKGTYKGREKGSSISSDEFLKKYKKEAKLIQQHPELSLRKLEALTGVSMNTVKKINALLGKPKG